MVDADAVTLSPGAAADSVLRYLRGHLALTTHGDTLQPTLLRGGEEAVEHHQGWWIAVHYEAAAPNDSLHVRNTSSSRSTTTSARSCDSCTSRRKPGRW